MMPPLHFSSPPDPISVRKDLWSAVCPRTAFDRLHPTTEREGLSPGNTLARKRDGDVAHSKVRLRRTKAARRCGAFSLIELLVVIAIAGLLTGLAVVGFRGISRASGARGASDLAASTALAARVEAMSHGHGALFVIDNSNDPKRKWQRIGVVRFTNSGANDYELVGRMTPLPSGTYFLPQYSSPDLIATNFTGLGGSGATPVLALEFGGTGHLVHPTDPRLVFRLVFSANIMNPSGNLENPEAMLAGRQGFLLRRNGRPTFFRDPSQMPVNP